MPNLYPGIKPVVGNGRPCVLLLMSLFLPFFLFAQPVITGFSPHSGPVGSTVTITGTNFSPTASANIVFFGSVKANVTAATATSLTVAVPTGASYQPLTVTTGGLTAFAAQPFVTTFSDPGQFMADAFSTRNDIPSGQTPMSVFSTDIDGDGKPDIVVATGDGNSMDIYLNTSTPQNISFTQVVSDQLPTSWYPSAITAGDLDGDGKPEIIVACYQSPKLAIFRNTSTPGNVSVVAPTAYQAIGNYTLSLTVADCNGDGKPEIVLASAASNYVSIFPNNSTTGNLSLGTRMDLHLPLGTTPNTVIASDLDGDGRTDLASVNYGANTVSVFRNTGPVGGTLSFAANVDFSVGGGANDLAVGDLDGDGKPDLAVVNNSDATITLLQNACTPGNINFIRGTDVPTGTMNPGSPQALRLGDFDGDGKPDIASVNELDQSVSVHRNISTAGAPAIDVNVDYAVGNLPWGLAIADYDGDGLPDLAIINNTSNTISVLRNKASIEASITSFTPTSGSSGTVVSITGANLNGATAVSFGGVAATSFTVNSATSITATVGGGATGVVTVLTPAGSASLGTFTYGAPTLSITNFNPTSGGPGTVVTIDGSNFTGTTSVSLGASPAASFTVVSDNQITAVVGNGSTGVISVAAGTNSGQSTASFTYTPPAISITSFSPVSGSKGAPVVIKGHGFLNADSVYFGNVSASRITITGDTSITAYVDSGASGSVIVVGPGGMDSRSGFTFIDNSPPPPPPSTIISITSFSPASAKTGDTLHIRGTNLSTANAVTLGGTNAQFQALSDSTLIAIVGAGSTGAVLVANSTNADSLLLFTFLYDTTKQSAPGAFQLIQFSGSLSGSNDPKLQWQVKNDAGISYYAVERSGDSILFNVVGTVRSMRSNGVSHTYTYTDADAVTGTNWYRLKMQDTTASYTYSKKIRVQPASQDMPVYPNPVKYGFFYLDVPDVNDASQIQLVDMAGKVLQSVKVAPGITQVRVNVPGLSAGTYRVGWTNGKRTASTTILVL
ncbi:MAG TPA: FG-GAP-like repeat-containing protein [Puia sp.]|uniref:FG-GAP-like repeat-containing protein n=1 Tax=Puia sp. TaxID=2045100 RepID=UPI002BEBAA67|nr:FG-GAP-like repeat-containing protein [Puia sp.]HVU96941.1 FG-GAP-like repeat-containing protein [Puia sp.]